MPNYIETDNTVGIRKNVSQKIDPIPTRYGMLADDIFNKVSNRGPISITEDMHRENSVSTNILIALENTETSLRDHLVRLSNILIRTFGEDFILEKSNQYKCSIACEGVEPKDFVSKSETFINSIDSHISLIDKYITALEKIV
jgi:hypothetical protein